MQVGAPSVRFGNPRTRAGLGDDLDDIATLADSLSTSAPDMLAAFENSITTSKTVVEKSDGLAGLLRAGTSTGSAATSLIGDNRDRMITLIDDADSLTGAITSRPDHITTFYNGLRNLTIELPPALAHGPWLSTDLRLSVTDLYPYGKTDCPQYDGTRGPNCPASATAFGGTVGPVGSPAEQSLISAITQGGTALDTLVAGPVFRGTTVVGG